MYGNLGRETMVKKFRNEPKEIRYHRVNLGEEDPFDEESDESKLDRALGPPKKVSVKRDCGKILRGFFIVFTVLVTLLGLISVIAYTAIMFPGGPTGKFNELSERFFGSAEANSTATNTTTTTYNSTIAGNITAQNLTNADDNSTNIPQTPKVKNDDATDSAQPEVIARAQEQPEITGM